MSDTAIRVVLVDDHRVVRRGLRMYLEAFEDVRVVGEASSGEELLAHLAEWRADVIVMDWLMPGGIDGLEATRRARAASAAQVVILSAQGDEARVPAALRAGAIGYVRKDADAETLLAAVRAAARGQGLLAAGANAAVFHGRESGAEALTAREREVLRLLALGRANKEIARALGVGEETVKTHVSSVLGKMGLSSRAQAIVAALKSGVVGLEEV